MDPGYLAFEYFNKLALIAQFTQLNKSCKFRSIIVSHFGNCGKSPSEANVGNSQKMPNCRGDIGCIL